ncbi:hypothetical protein EDB81DRAFT_769042 [Dactylonectria macrodidyma]|uniref:Uncharacterized protein n=1 Tax=Dactylonectria macrodidyma TaxID=307937 RepID=A0A9P9I806_9HYPO|nr:hypothetical protein EDB81DRAFT_769042 [Dactylonectria macrodidyma]
MAPSRASWATKKLASLRERVRSSRKPPSVSRLFNNHDLVSQTCRHLGDVDIAALALSCQQALQTVGRGVLKLHGEDKFQLLQRLEGDGYLMEKGMILCPALAAILRSHRHKSNFYDPEILATFQRYKIGSKSLSSIWVEVQPNIIHNQLIIRSYISIFSGNSNIVMPHLKEFLDDNSYLMDICKHRKWQDVLGVIKPDADPDAARRFAHDCVWLRGRDKAKAKEKEEEASQNAGTTRRNKVALCDDCCTAFVVSSCKQWGDASPVVLDIWKNYGYGRDLDDPMWLSHTGIILDRHDSRRYIAEAAAFEGKRFTPGSEYCPFQWMREDRDKRAIVAGWLNVGIYYWGRIIRSGKTG